MDGDVVAAVTLAMHPLDDYPAPVSRAWEDHVRSKSAQFSAKIGGPLGSDPAGAVTEAFALLLAFKQGAIAAGDDYYATRFDPVLAGIVERVQKSKPSHAPTSHATALEMHRLRSRASTCDWSDLCDVYDKMSDTFSHDMLDTGTRLAISEHVPVVTQWATIAQRNLGIDVGTTPDLRRETGSYVMDGYMFARCVLGTANSRIAFTTPGGEIAAAGKMLDAIKDVPLTQTEAALGPVAEMLEGWASHFSRTGTLATWASADFASEFAYLAMIQGVLIADAEHELFVGTAVR